ncbi:MAG: FG-GAP-like repeat-containing protein [Planctomycetaceae bacterium]
MTRDREPSAYQQMQAHADAGQWTEASALIETVLIELPTDPAALEAAARAAFHTDQKNLAADLLVDACKVTDFRQQNRIRQAFTGLLAVGRVFDAIELLERGVEAEPGNVEMRKLLRSFLLGVERHLEARTHARILIQQRKFDIELLQSLGDQDRRTQEADSLVEMTKRNPSDLRPLIGKARFNLDRGQFDECIEVLNRILSQHPDDAVAQVMLGRALVLAGQQERLANWSQNLPTSVQKYADYWLTLGDWASHDGQDALALQAYANSAQRDFDQVQIWDKFASALGRRDPSSPDLATVRERSQLLGKLRQLQANFEIKNEKSATVYEEIALTLAELGRLWEAEAWVALGQVALSSPTESGMSNLAAVRGSIVQRLSKQTPWQSPIELSLWTDAHANDRTDLLNQLSGSTTRKVESHRATVAPAVLPLLTDEAAKRGLDFFGKTGEHLDRPGIRIHRTLGCGGGSIDYDLDGWPDIYLTAAGGTPPNSDSNPNALFRNLGGSFVEVAAPSGCDDRGFGQGISVGDVNADGFDDLLVLNYGLNRMLINNGDGTFVDASERWLADQDATMWSTSAAIADLDGDAIADAVITNYLAGLDPSKVDCDSEGLEGHRSCSPLYFPAAPDLFLKGDATGRFQNATERWNATPEILGRGLGIVIGTFTPGRCNDVYIVNDMTSNHFWTRASQTGPFQLTETGAICGLANDAFSRTQGSMGIATTDLNGDGVIDFYVTNFDNEYSTLYVSRDNQFWSDDTTVHGLSDVTMPMVGFGSKAIDLDSNGNPELLVANGHVDIFDGVIKKADYAQPFQVFAQNREGKFESIESKIDSAYFQNMHVGRTLFMLDINRDQRRDAVVTHQTEPVALLMNQTPSDYRSLNLRFVATKSERNAIGTRVAIRAHNLSATATVTSGDGYLCSDERCLQFGLGELREPVAIEIQWPSGTREQLQLGAEHDWLLVEGEQPFQLAR